MPQFNTPGNQSPGGSLRSAPYSRVFTNPGATDLRVQVSQANNSASGALVIATAAASAFSYQDTTGATVALTGLAAGVYDFAGIAMSAINSSTTCIVVVYWHGTAAQ